MPRDDSQIAGPVPAVEQGVAFVDPCGCVAEPLGGETPAPDPIGFWVRPVSPSPFPLSARHWRRQNFGELVRDLLDPF